MTTSNRNVVRWTVISWAPHCRRSEAFAQALGASFHRIHYLRFQRPADAPAKYLLQAAATLRVLLRERPRAIHVQLPPFPSGIVVALYALAAGAEYVFDHHSATFSRKWRWAIPFLIPFARRARANLVTNDYWARRIAAWGARVMVIADPMPPLPPGEPYPVSGKFNVVYVSTFAPDEPLEAVLAAARSVPEATIYVTGDAGAARRSLLERIPPNVVLTGFLPAARYVGLLRSADAIMSLTLRDHTLQCGGCEAVTVGRPLLTSDWPYLRRVFYKGTVHVRNTAEDIARGIREMAAERSKYAEEVAALAEESRLVWTRRLADLDSLVGKAD